MTKIETKHLLIDELGLDLKQDGFIKEHFGFADIRSIDLKWHRDRKALWQRSLLAVLLLCLALVWILAVVKYVDWSQLQDIFSGLLFLLILLPPLALIVIVTAVMLVAIKKKWMLVLQTTDGRTKTIVVSEVQEKGQLYDLYTLLKRRSYLQESIIVQAAS